MFVLNSIYKAVCWSGVEGEKGIANASTQTRLCGVCRAISLNARNVCR